MYFEILSLPVIVRIAIFIKNFMESKDSIQNPEKGALLFQNGRIETVAKPFSIFGIPLIPDESLHDKLQKFALYTNGVVFVSENRFLPLELIESITLDGGHIGFSRGRLPSHIWFNLIGGESKEFPLILASANWRDSFTAILLGGASAKIYPVVTALGFTESEHNPLSEKMTFKKIASS